MTPARTVWIRAGRDGPDAGREQHAANFGHDAGAGLVGPTIHAEAGFLSESPAPIGQVAAGEELSVESDPVLDR